MPYSVEFHSLNLRTMGIRSELEERQAETSTTCEPVLHAYFTWFFTSEEITAAVVNKNQITI